MPSIALAIRRALTLDRSPEVFKVEAPIMQQGDLDRSNRGELIHVPTREGAITMNSNIWYVFHLQRIMAISHKHNERCSHFGF